MTERELAVRLVRNGIATHRRTPGKFTDANRDEEVRAAGNAAIANSLEFLGKHSVVADVQPTFVGGMGFAYKISEAAVAGLATDKDIEARVGTLFDGPKTETSETIRELLRGCEQGTINATYRDDLLASLRELDTCFRHDCFIACLAMSGKILEICLKQVMLDSEIPFDDTWMIGTLLRKLKEAACEKYIDQSLGDIANIINKSRIPAVHSKEKIPVPSRAQAVMVIHAVADTVNRTILKP